MRVSLLKNDGIKSRIGEVVLLELGEKSMAEEPDELKKLASIATDLKLSGELRIKAIELLGKISTHEALLVLLELAGNDRLVKGERELALKQAREIIRASH